MKKTKKAKAKKTDDPENLVSDKKNAAAKKPKKSTRTKQWTDNFDQKKNSEIGFD